MANDVTYLINLRDQFSGKLNSIQKQTGAFERQVGGLSNTLKKFAGIAAGAFSIYGAFEFLKGSKEMLDKLESSVSRMNQELLTTKGAVGLSSKELQDNAKNMSKTVLNSRSEIIEAQTQLLRYTNVSGSVFKKAMPLIADYATFTKTTLSGAVDKVGMALGGNRRGLMMLEREFGALSTKQELHLKNLLKQNDLYHYQTELLTILQGKVGGQAKAATLTDEGKIIMAKKAMDDFRLGVGRLISSLEVALIPAFLKIVQGVKDFVKWFQSASTGATVFRYIVEAIAAALLLYGTYLTVVTVATKLWTIAQWALDSAMWASGVPEIVIGIVALIAAIMVAWDKCEGFRRVVGGVFESVKKYVMGMVHYFVNLGTIIGDIFTGKWSKLKDDAGKFTKDFKNDFISGWGEAWKKGADNAAKSKFKFGNILKMLPGAKDANGNPTINTGNTVSQGDNITKIESAAPRVFNTNITKMVGIETLETQNLGDAKSNLGQALLELLVGAANDAQITVNI